MSRYEQIEQQLQQHFQPQALEVIDESAQHNVPPGAESHFKVVIVSEQFAAQRLIQRHRAVNQCLKFAFDQGMHALSIHTYTPAEWQQRADGAPDSPACLGGSQAG